MKEKVTFLVAKLYAKFLHFTLLIFTFRYSFWILQIHGEYSVKFDYCSKLLLRDCDPLIKY
jgi:hypothetical protein